VTDRTRWAPLGMLVGVLLVSHVWMNEARIPFGNPNVLSRVYLALAMAGDGTFRIDRWVEETDIQDKAEYDGHTYSDKAPGASLLLVPLAALVRAVFGESDVYLLALWLRLLGLSLPVVGFWLAVRGYFARLTDDPRAADAVVSAGALGTVFFIYATELFAHATAGMLLFASYLLVRAVVAEPEERGAELRCLAAGAIAGLAFTVDYVVVLAVPVLFLWVARSGPRPWRHACLFAAACAVPLMGWMAYNVACFDHPLRVGFHFHADSDYRPQYRSGLLGIQPPSGEGLWLLLLSPARGLCFLSPVLLLALVGWRRQWRSRSARTDAAMSAAIVGAIVLFAATTVDPGGGWAVASRYLTATVPFLLIGVAGWIRDAERWGLALYAGLALVGLMLVPLAAATFPVFPHGVENPIFELAWPLLRAGYVMPSVGSDSFGVAALVPFFVCFVGAASFQLDLVARRAGLGALVASLAIAVVIIAVQATIPERPERAWWRGYAVEFALESLGRDAEAARYRATGDL